MWFVFQLVEPIRTLLAFTDTEFEDKTYDMGPAPDFSRSSWFDIKSTINVPFPNVSF